LHDNLNKRKAVKLFIIAYFREKLVNTMQKIILSSPEETEQFAADLFKCVPEKCLIFLQGDLGAGKTTLVRGFMRAAGYDGVVKSPTYNIVEEYELEQRLFYHFDLYRLVDAEELEWLGMEDYLKANSVCFIEWPDNGDGYLTVPDIILTLSVRENERELLINKMPEKIYQYLSC